jgi:hypothetical protein
VSATNSPSALRSNSPLARTLEFFDLAHSHASAERLGAHDQNLDGVGARSPRLLQAPLSEIHARFNSRFN